MEVKGQIAVLLSRS